MSGLGVLIDSLATGDPDETAAAVFDSLGCPQKWREVFYSVVRDECRRRYRTTVRDMEGHRTPETHGLNAAMSRTAYLAERFWNGDHYVLWGEATVADHLGRIAALSKLRSGLDSTIARHQQAIDDINAAGVACLGEIAAGVAA